MYMFYDRIIHMCGVYEDLLILSTRRVAPYAASLFSFSLSSEVIMSVNKYTSTSGSTEATECGATNACASNGSSNISTTGGTDSIWINGYNAVNNVYRIQQRIHTRCHVFIQFHSILLFSRPLRCTDLMFVCIHHQSINHIAILIKWFSFSFVRNFLN